MTDLATLALIDGDKSTVDDEIEQALKMAAPTLRRYAFRLTGNGADSDDLFQETLLRAWRARERFEVGSNASAWLKRIAKNCFLSRLRQAKRFVELDPEFLETKMVSSAQQETNLLLRELEIAKGHLHESQRRAFELIVDEGLSYEEAAERMGIPVGTVKSQVARARLSLTKNVAGLTAITPSQIQPTTAMQNAGGLYAQWKATGSRVIGARHVAC